MFNHGLLNSGFAKEERRGATGGGNIQREFHLISAFSTSAAATVRMIAPHSLHSMRRYLRELFHSDSRSTLDHRSLSVE